MDTKSLGNIGEAVAIASFVKYDIPVYLPFGDNEKADLIAEFNGRLNKIQVKTSVKASDGRMIFDLTSRTTHRHNGSTHKYTPNEIDYFFCYNIERDKSSLIKYTMPNITEISLVIVIIFGMLLLILSFTKNPSLYELYYI